MQAFISYISRFGHLAPEQTSAILAKAVVLQLPKGGVFSKAGKVATQVGFIEEGIIRVGYYNSEGEEVTKYFIEENNIVVDLNSFDNNIPSPSNVHAITDCRLLVFSRQHWLQLLETIEGWSAIVHKITQHALLQKVERISPLLAENATARYLSFMDKYPALANRIPLSYIASYLGVTQSSLSRIRRSLR